MTGSTFAQLAIANTSKSAAIAPAPVLNGIVNETV
jgi:hypothetical protein